VISWQPHPGPQTEFCSRGEFEVLYGGAAGGGKTDCLIAEASRDIENPKYNGLILRRTFPQLQEIIDRCFQWYPGLGGIYRSTEHRWYFPSGAKINLGHMQHGPDKYSYQGKEYSTICFDECTQFESDQYLYLFSRCRSTEPELRPRVLSTTNPGGISHRFFKERFIDIGPPGVTYIDTSTGLSRVFIPGKLTDNPTLLESDPTYVSRLQALPNLERMRLLEGVWDLFEGQVFRELSQRVHGCDPFPIPPEWEKFLSFDWGYSKPFSVGWYAVDFDGIVYRYREWYGCQPGESDKGVRMTSTEVARGILEREREKIKYRVADPACWNPQVRKDKTMGPSIVEDMGREGVYFLKADNNRELGKLQVHQRLRLDEEEKPQFLIFNNCKAFWNTFPELRADEKNDEDVDTRQEDHVYDEVRYALMSRPIVPKRREVVPPNSMLAERLRLKKARAMASRDGISWQQAYLKMHESRIR
jgi:hypothetical protein